jgi:hypothetical protein
MKLFSKKTLLFISILSTQLTANSIVDDFLFTDQSTINQNGESIKSIYQNNEFQNSYIEKARLSIEHSHFSDVERDYSLRLYTKSFSEVENEKNLYFLEKNLYLNKEYINSLNILKQRYDVLLDLIYKYTLINLIDEEINFKKEALKKAKFFIDNKSDISAVYSKKVALSDSKLSKSKLQYKYNNTLSKIEQILKNRDRKDIEKEMNLSLFLAPFNCINFISKNLENNMSATEDNNLFLKESINKFYLTQQKLKFTEIENDIKLNNVELKYDDSKKRKNAMSISIGIEIPFSENRAKNIKNKIKVLTAKQKSIQNHQKITDKISYLKKEIKEYINYFNEIDAQISDNTPKKSNFYSYKLFTDMKKREIKLKKERSKIVYQIAQKYIALLYWSNTIEDTKFNTLFQHNQ